MFATRQISLFFIDNVIEMPVIRIVLLLIVVGGLALFAFSNLSPVLSLVFLGMQTPVLPLATWMGIAIASGVVTSFLLQFLSFVSMGSSTRRFADSEEVESQRRPFGHYEPVPESDGYSPPPPPPPQAPPTSSASDWEERNGENWDFEQSAATSTRQGGNSSSSTRNSQSDSVGSTEATPQPPTNSPSGVYSYSYREREQKQAGVGKTDVVYDANYRVIMPPNQPIQPEDDEDDWGFEDDEDFNNDESKNTKKSR